MRLWSHQWINASWLNGIWRDGGNCWRQAGPNWRKQVTGSMAWKDLSCPGPFPSLSPSCFILSLPACHELSIFPLPHSCLKQWSKWTMDWNFWTCEPKYMFLLQVVSVRYFVHSDKNLTKISTMKPVPRMMPCWVLQNHPTLSGFSISSWCITSLLLMQSSPKTAPAAFPTVHAVEPLVHSYLLPYELRACTKPLISS